MDHKGSLIAAIIFRATILTGVGIAAWAQYEFWVWEPAQLPFDFPDKAIALAVLATGVLLSCSVWRLMLSIDTRRARVEFAILAILALWFPGQACWCCMGLTIARIH